MFNRKLKKVKCKKSLRKSTYKTYAFTKGYVYYVLEESKDFYHVEDNLKNVFDFSKYNTDTIFYKFTDYFEDVQ